jgi:hypothetical protein
MKQKELILETSYDKSVRRDISKLQNHLESKYEFLLHLQTSSLSGDNIKNVFDEIINYMLKKKSVELSQSLCEKRLEPLGKK